MRLKIMWTHFLRLGSLLTLITVISCKGQIDALVKADWVYENTSSHKIEVASKDFNSFIIQPGESYIYSESGDGPKKMTPENYVSPYRVGDKIIVNGDIVHVLQKGESITEVMNYEAEKIKHNYYRFTYTFTDEILQSFKD